MMTGQGFWSSEVQGGKEQAPYTWGLAVTLRRGGGQEREGGL
jgi:hypothetical protein